MIDELTKTFFDTFGIEPKYKDYRTKNGKIYNSKNPQNRNIRLCYPQITDRHYLELICVYNRYDSPFISGAIGIENLKIHILNSLIIIFECKNTDEFKHQVQELFKECE